MAEDGAIFIRRALVFLRWARAKDQATPTRLARDQECSVPTARRVVQRLQYEYNAPLQYDPAVRSWVLVDDAWTFEPGGLVPRGELIKTGLALRLAGHALDPGMDAAVRTLRARLAEGLRMTPGEQHRLERAYDGDRTDAVALKDPVVMELVFAVAKRRRAFFTYRSAWSDGEKHHDVSPHLVRQVDGALYLLATEQNGDARVFSLAAMEDVSILDEEAVPLRKDLLDQWLGSYGVWLGTPVSVVVTIHSRAARFFARQAWHPAQEDRVLKDGALRRSFPASVSPEVIRRLLFVGADLVDVEPPELKAGILEAAATAVHSLTLRNLAPAG